MPFLKMVLAGLKFSKNDLGEVENEDLKLNPPLSERLG